jgi:hypothetical protein
MMLCEQASEGKSEKGKTPFCQGCKTKKSEFVCAGCSNRWYCSRECQVSNVLYIALVIFSKASVTDLPCFQSGSSIFGNADPVADPNADPGFDDQNWKNFTAGKNYIYFD